jgi:hypothetical protein
MRYYPNRDQSWLESALERLDEEMLTGFITELEADGLMGKKTPQLSIDERRRRILNDLCEVDPDNYRRWEVMPTTRTKIAYAGDATNSGSVFNSNTADLP